MSKNKNKLNVTNASESLSVEEKRKLQVKGRKLLDFSQCTTSSHPSQKKEWSLIIDALQSFESDDKLKLRHNHDLTNKGDIKKNVKKIQNFIKTYNKVYSIDVGDLDSKDRGKMRLLYYLDKDNPEIAHILDCYIDTH